MTPSRHELQVRARDQCEYCRLPQVASRLRFQVDHVVARQHRGPDTADNLALACVFCNAKKGPNLAGLDPLTGDLTRLYHPRQDRWTDHFGWSGEEGVGLSAVGRTTVVVLAMNDDAQVARRRQWADAGLFPWPP